MFVQLPASQTGVYFNNEIIENDSINIISLPNIYNGGGVGIGDFNKDGLPDIYLSGNLVSNKLYLNKGGLKFDDITATACVGGDGKWCRGVSVVDINNDGWPDIYVCATINKNAKRRENLLYINQHNDKNGVPHFKDMAVEYGLNDSSYSTTASFFDYDNDGDLDVYIVVNQILDDVNPDMFSKIVTDGSFPSTGKLYRNDWSKTLKHAVFTDVSKQAGVIVPGYGHSVNTCDINNDGWKDIYVTNDFASSNILYINNQDGTFTDRSREYFKHTSLNAMGMDIADINNDGLEDVVELDMNPRDNYRKKMFLNANRYQTFENIDYYGYQYQYVRNTLQLNQGPRVNSNDSIGMPVFSEISFLSGVAETDWSWAPIVADFDNDGYRDIIVTNGFTKDVTDHDFSAFRGQVFLIASALTVDKDVLDKIPQVKINNYAFKNNGDLTFTDVSANWGIAQPSFSNGAAYVDLDNDGDLDYVVNNINDGAFVYENKTSKTKGANHYLQVNLVGDSLNVDGIGAKIELHYSKGKQQITEVTPYRGYLSSIQPGAHFGLGDVKIIDTVIIKWPGGNKQQTFKNVVADAILTAKYKDAKAYHSTAQPVYAPNTWFTEITDSLGVSITHKEDDYVDFNVQKLLPHKLSDYGPGMAVGDINGDGLDDLVVGGANSYSTKLLIQQPNGKFVTKALFPYSDQQTKPWKDMGLLLFDADNDGDNDLYISSGGSERADGSGSYQDHLFLNDGKGNFTEDAQALPANTTSKSCVRAFDFNNDGKQDLLVTGRCAPGKYPQPVSSFIYRNDCKDGVVKFTDVTKTVAPVLDSIGMVCDALITDFDNDGQPDIIVAGEWMPITFLKNNNGVFTNITNSTGIQGYMGWWNSIVAGDFDNDGDIDYIVGNLGQNSYYKASDQYPAYITAGDFNHDGIYDAFPSLFLQTSQLDTAKREFPAESRDDAIKQVLQLRTKFQNYKSFAAATMTDVFTKEQLSGALRLKANYFASALLRNNGNGKFSLQALPVQAQIAPINGMIAEDFDGDGNLDVAMSGNDFGTEVATGRYDAFNGLVLKGDGKGGFTPLSILQSGIFIPGNGKALAELIGANNNCLIAASQNRGALKVFSAKNGATCMPVLPNDAYALIVLKTGSVQKKEFYNGSSYLAQQGRFLLVSKSIKSVTIVTNSGEKRQFNISSK